MPSIARIRLKLLGCATACLLALALGAAPVTVLALALATAAIPASLALLGGRPMLRTLAGRRPPRIRSSGRARVRW